MSDAPERIWLLPFDGEQRTWCSDPDPSGLGHEAEADEYVRADLIAKAREDALREASDIASAHDYALQSVTGADIRARKIAADILALIEARP